MHLLQEELEREGIWDFDRLSLPYIRQEFVQVTDFSVLAIWSTLLMVINSLHLTYDLKTKSDTMSVLIYTSLFFFFFLISGKIWSFLDLYCVKFSERLSEGPLCGKFMFLVNNMRLPLSILTEPRLV
jgi:hypothetical protein